MSDMTAEDVKYNAYNIHAFKNGQAGDHNRADIHDNDNGMQLPFDYGQLLGCYRKTRHSQLIPAWNSIQNLKDIICLDYSSTNVLISCGVNIVVSLLSVFIIGKCFESEKIVNG